MDDFDVDDALQQALDRLTLLNDVADALSSTLDAVEGLRRVCRIVVPQLADWVMADLLDAEGRLERVCLTHHDLDVGVADPSGPLPEVPTTASGPLSRVLLGAGPLLLSASDVPAADQASDPLHAANLELFARLGGDNLIVAPLRARRRVLGAFTIVRHAGRPALQEADLALVEDLTHRIALALDNARLYKETQKIAERLQRSLLPSLPELPGLEITARYAPAATGADVGGDWYDSFRLPQGDTTLIIGDVTGHDLRAAVTMSQLRNMLRGIACDRQEPPAQILRRFDMAVNSLSEHTTATCIYALLSGATGGPWHLHWATAGHPPPLLITQEGDTQYLDEVQGLLLGVHPTEPRVDARRPLPPGSTILLYTDGLLERRGEDIGSGLTRLRQHAAALHSRPLGVLCDELLTGLAAHSTDDVALLALRLPAAR